MPFARVSRWLRSLIAICLLLVVMAACTTADDEGNPEPTATVAPPTATATVAVTATLQTLDPVSGQAISDGICLAIIPDGWVDDGTGRGQTSGGGRFVLFGGNVANDAAWTTASNVVATPTGGRAIQSEERAGDSIFVTYADGKGFEYRQRFGAKYCDLTVTSVAGFTPEQQAIWPAIIDTLAPVTQ